MEFRDLVANEASALLERALVRHSQESLREFAAFRDALGEALSTLESALAESAEGRGHAEIVSLVTRLALNARSAGAEAETALAEARRQLAAASGQETMLRAQLAAAEAEIRQLRADAESMANATAHVERALVAAKTRIAELTAGRSGQEPVAGAPAPADMEHLNALYLEIERGSSVEAVLIALARGLSHQFARVSLFSVNGNALQGVFQTGFDINKDITKIIVPLALDSILAGAVGTGRVQTSAPTDTVDSTQLPFGGTSGWCVALPVSVNDGVVAAIYADDGHGTPPDERMHSARLAVAELARRHAISVLGKLTADLKALAELRDYATLLLDEIEYIYAADTSAGKQNIELVEQLTGNLRCAQETFARRIESAPVPEAGALLFEERLNHLIDVKGATPFGRHLSIAAAAVMTQESSGATTAPQSVAQAS